MLTLQITLQFCLSYPNMDLQARRVSIFQFSIPAIWIKAVFQKNYIVGEIYTCHLFFSWKRWTISNDKWFMCSGFEKSVLFHGKIITYVENLLKATTCRCCCFQNLTCSGLFLLSLIFKEFRLLFRIFRNVIFSPRLCTLWPFIFWGCIKYQKSILKASLITFL